MARVSYLFVQLKDGCSIPNLNSEMPTHQYTRQEKTHHLDAYQRDQLGERKRALFIERDGGDLFVRSVRGGFEQVLPWDNVRHAVVEPAAETKARKERFEP